MKPAPELEHQDEHQDEQEEQQDDAIIGRAFKWSLLGFATIAAIVAGILFSRSSNSAPEVVIDKNTDTIESLNRDFGAMPKIQFTDVTLDSGVDYQHFNGATGHKLLPETMGGGVAIFDFNNDDAPDLLFVNGTSWPDENSVKPPNSSLALYANDGGGKFEDVTDQAGLTTQFYGMGCAVGDVDNDGDSDLFITCVGENRFFRNEGSVFVDATSVTGLAGDNRWSSSAGFFDYDRDGFIDLFVCNYVAWSPEIDVELNFTLNGEDRAYGPPTNYGGLQCYLYHNRGDGTFEEVGKQAGIHIVNETTGRPVGKSLAIVLADLDQDGFDDILVANDTVQNFMFHNRGDGTFEEVGMVAGIAFDRNGKSTGAMGIDVAHPWNDDQCAVGIANFANEMTSFYVTAGDRLAFVDEALMNGIGSPSRSRLSFGLLFFDADLDGYVDFLQANGHLEDEIAEVQPSQTYQQRAQLFWNCSHLDRSCYKIMPDEFVGSLATPIVGRGAACGDLDADGDLDLVMTQIGGSPLVLRNDQNTGHHWLRVRLVGGESNREALGATIELATGDIVQTRIVTRTRSYLSQNELVATFGLGEHQSADSITISWPNGKKTQLANVTVDQTLVVDEP